MKRLAPLLLLLIATAHADTLSFGPARELAPLPFVSFRGPASVVGAATNGKRVLMVWTALQDQFSEGRSYVTFVGGESKMLPPDASPTAVVWSGAAFFVFGHDGRAMRVSPDGTLSEPFKFGYVYERNQIAANGDGFIDAWWDGRLHARLFDRNGAPLHEIEPVPAPPKFIAAARENGDYVITTVRDNSPLQRVIVHRDGSREVEKSERTFPNNAAMSAAGDAVVIDNTLLLAGREIELDGHAALAWDGASYLVATPKGLRRYTRAGTLIDAAPRDYGSPAAVVPRRFLPPLVIWTTPVKALRASDDALQFRRLIDQTYPAASSNGASTVVAWREANVLKIKVLGRPGTVDVELQTSTHAIRAISVPGVHFVVWLEEYTVRMLRVGANGVRLDPAPAVLARTSIPLHGSTPAVATNGRELFVAWPDRPSARARYVTPGGIAGEPFDLGTGDYNWQAKFDGEHYVLFWFELGSGGIPFGPPPPQRLLSAVVNGRKAEPPIVVAKEVWTSGSLAVTQSSVLWSDYQVPHSDSIDPSTPMQWQFYLRSAALDGAGAPANVAHMNRYGHFWPAKDLAILSDVALWTEERDLFAMPLGGGEAAPVGPAAWGTLNVVRTNDGPLLVYAIRSGGVSRIVTRSPGSARTAPDTSAPPDRR